VLILELCYHTTRAKSNVHLKANLRKQQLGKLVRETGVANRRKKTKHYWHVAVTRGWRLVRTRVKVKVAP